MEQPMRSYDSTGSKETSPPHTFGHLTATNRDNTYGRYQTSGEALLRIKEMRSDMARRQVAQIKAAIADFEQTASALEREIEIEHARTGIRDPRDNTYSMYARATIARRDNLKRSINDLKDRLVVAKVSLAEVTGDAQRRK